MDRVQKMMRGNECCKDCNIHLKTRESADSVLLVCTNPRCRNYWIHEGSEIIMILK